MNQPFEFDTLAVATNYRAAIAREFAPFLTGRVVEVGAGVGQFTAELARLPAIREVIAVEPEPGFCEKLRGLPLAIRVVPGTISALPAGFACDAIVSVNVLEHIADDEAELRHYGDLLRSCAGHLCLFVPARPELYAPLDGDMGHHRRYTRPALRQKLPRAGLRIERLHYFNSVGYFAWFGLFRVLRKRRFDPRQVVWFDRYIFPIVHTLERGVAWPPLGQSLLAVARAGTAD